MNARLALALSIVAVIFSAGALGLELYEKPILRRVAAAARPTAEELPYVLVMVADHHLQTVSFKSAHNCREAAAFFSSGKVTADCVAAK